MNLDHLPGHSGPEIAGRAIHDTDQGGKIVRELGAGTDHHVIDMGEIVFMIDPGADVKGWPEDAQQDRTFRIIGGWVIRGEERTAPYFLFDRPTYDS